VEPGNLEVHTGATLTRLAHVTVAQGNYSALRHCRQRTSRAVATSLQGVPGHRHLPCRSTSALHWNQGSWRLTALVASAATTDSVLFWHSMRRPIIQRLGRGGKLSTSCWWLPSILRDDRSNDEGCIAWRRMERVGSGASRAPRHNLTADGSPSRSPSP